jgi:CBS domain-containing protein
VGLLVPTTLGVGYDNIEHLLGGGLLGRAALVFCVAKLVSWTIALGSGTSGGTLAPLFTIGGGLGAVLGGAVAGLLPAAGVDPRVAALVGMAAMFAGASRALLASVVFAFETTRQPLGLLPLLGGCAAGYLASCLLMRHSIMTEKIARRGASVPSEYGADLLEQVLVREVCSRAVVALDADQTVAGAREWLAGAGGRSHQGFPVHDRGELIGVVTRRDLADGAAPEARVRDVIKRPPAIVFEDSTLREAADHMVFEAVGRLPVVARGEPRKTVGMLTRSDLLAAHARRLHAAGHREQAFRR